MAQKKELSLAQVLITEASILKVERFKIKYLTDKKEKSTMARL
jgi:hypothetical protein